MISVTSWNNSLFYSKAPCGSGTSPSYDHTPRNTWLPGFLLLPKKETSGGSCLKVANIPLTHTSHDWTHHTPHLTMRGPKCSPCPGECAMSPSPTQLLNPRIHYIWGGAPNLCQVLCSAWSYKDSPVLKKFSRWDRQKGVMLQFCGSSKGGTWPNLDKVVGSVMQASV